MELQNLPWYGQLVVFLLIGGLLFGIFYFAYYSDGQSKITSLQTRIEGLDQEINKLTRKKADLKKMQTEVEQKNAMLTKLKEVLPETKEISQILKKIQSIVSSARLEIIRWESQSPVRQKIYDQHPFRISLEGNYHNLGMFFDQLSRLKKIFTVDNLKLSPHSEMSRQKTIRVEFVASTYTFPEKAAAVKTGKGGAK